MGKSETQCSVTENAHEAKGDDLQNSAVRTALL